MLEEVIEQIRENTEGLLPEDITALLEQCPNVDAADVPRLAGFITSLNA